MRMAFDRPQTGESEVKSPCRPPCDFRAPLQLPQPLVSLVRIQFAAIRCGHDEREGVRAAGVVHIFQAVT